MKRAPFVGDTYLAFDGIPFDRLRTFRLEGIRSFAGSILGAGDVCSSRSFGSERRRLAYAALERMRARGEL